MDEVVIRKEIAVKRHIQNEKSRLAFFERERRREEKAQIETLRQECSKAEKPERDF